MQLNPTKWSKVILHFYKPFSNFIFFWYKDYALSMKNYSQTKYYPIGEIPAPITTFTIKNLQAGMKYRFRVAAENKFGFGDHSAEAKEWLQTKVIGIQFTFCFNILYCMFFLSYSICILFFISQ